MHAGGFERVKARAGARPGRTNSVSMRGRYRPRLSVLTDGENLSSKIMEALFGVTATLGDASRRHIHHDRTQANMRGWKILLAAASAAANDAAQDRSSTARETAQRGLERFSLCWLSAKLALNCGLVYDRPDLADFCVLEFVENIVHQHIATG